LDGTNPIDGNFLFPRANSAGGDPSIDVPASVVPDLSAAAGALGGWLTTPEAPGGSWGAAPEAIPSTWAINTETAIIYTIDGGLTGLTDVEAEFGVDNGVFVFLNGTFLGGQLRPGGAVLGEFSLSLGDLGAGTNYLQILREDHGGGTGWSISVTGEPAPIPLPASAWLLGAGLGGLVALRRRKA
jgi:hypothetical protein